MARGTRKQDKRRVKRQERIREQRRITQGSPYQRIATRGELKACYLSRDWKSQGIGALLCLHTAPGGSYAMAAFLIDFWCIGLKDAWGRIDIGMTEFRDVLARSQEHGDVLVRIDPEIARRILAGAICFAQQNGFRLPARYDRWMTLLGGVTDIAQADITDFGVDGGLRYVGTENDLRQRLVCGTVEQFINRPDVKFVFGLDAPPEVAEDLDPSSLEDAVERARERFMEVFLAWCFAKKIGPHPRIREAWDLTTESAMQAGNPDDEGASPEAIQAAADAYVDRFMALCEPNVREELAAAIIQLSQCVTDMGDSPELATLLNGNDDEDHDPERA